MGQLWQKRFPKILQKAQWENLRNNFLYKKSDLVDFSSQFNL